MRGIRGGIRASGDCEITAVDAGLGEDFVGLIQRLVVENEPVFDDRESRGVTQSDVRRVIERHRL